MAEEQKIKYHEETQNKYYCLLFRKSNFPKGIAVFFNDSNSIILKGVKIGFGFGSPGYRSKSSTDCIIL